MMSDSRTLMEVDDLHVHFATSRGLIRAVEGLSYGARRGEMVAIVGESGCGKSVSALGVMRLIPRPGRIVGGRVMFEGRDLLGLSNQEMRQVRGREIAMIFQDPMTSLNPVLPIGLQIMEPMLAHLGMDDAAARGRAVELLTSVGIPDALRRMHQYPHQFSGGMRQRVMIAMGLACNPKLLIADEPTTALDVTIQAQILSLLKELSQDRGIAIVIITHNLGVVARYADRVNVMYAARLVERTTTGRIFARPCHPYTAGLMRSVPRLDRPPTPRLATIEGLPPDLLAPPAGCRFVPRCSFRLERCQRAPPPLVEIEPDHWSACIRAPELAEGRLNAPDVAPSTPAADRISTADPLLEVEDLTKRFPLGGAGAVLLRSKEQVTAVNRVSFRIHPGETLALVGESGSGKTTTARTILRLEEPTGGRVRFEGVDLTAADARAMKDARRRIQIIFQDPYGSLNPRMTIGDILAEPLRVFRLEPTGPAVRARVTELLTQVGLFPYMAARYPHELSGGQRQRVGIARALAMQPRLIICDEPVSALDVSIQGQIINLLGDLQAELALTYLFIAHDLAVVRHIADRVVVLYLGRVMETASRQAIYDHPQHPYTQALLEAAPIPDPVVERERANPVLPGEIPSLVAPPPGCVFHTRCPHASAECRAQVPVLREVRPNHFAACVKL